MKRIFITLFVFTTIIGVILSGCGATSGETKQVAAVEEKQEQEETIGETKNNQEDASVDEIEEAVEGTTDTTIDEQVIVDQDNIKITATGYMNDSIWGEGINLLLENNTEKNITIGCNALIVNDYMINDLFVAEIAAGKKSNEVMYLASSELKAAGIDSVGKVEIYFHIYDSDSYDEVCTLDSVEIHTSAFDNMDTTVDDAGMELYNDNGVRIVGKTVDENSFWGTAILLYCENTSGKNLNIMVDNMSINGFMMEPLFSATVYDGKKAVQPITIFSSDMEANGIESIDEVELQFKMLDADSFSTIDETEPITFTAK